MAKQRSKGLYQRREYKEDELVNLGFRAKAKLVEAVHRAAEKEKARSTSAWLNEVVLQAAAKTLGVDPRTLDPAEGAPITSPEAAAQVAQLSALLLDVQDRLGRLGVAVPAVEAKSRRR
jgi:hypothetical protein